jgi:DinB superfamily
MTLAEQRLNSNHGRLRRAARAVPPALRDVAMPGSEWTPRELLAHVLAWQDEALRRLRGEEVLWPRREELDAWNETMRRRMAGLAWEEILARLAANHDELRAILVGQEPPPWFGGRTYRHYTQHTRTLIAFAQAAAQSPTTTVVPIAAQS